eukprot:4017021-Pleurochrysis_carterae.AAC.1
MPPEGAEKRSHRIFHALTAAVVRTQSLSSTRTHRLEVAPKNEWDLHANFADENRVESGRTPSLAGMVNFAAAATA